MKIAKKEVKNIINKIADLQNYRGRKFFLEVSDKITFSNTNWCEGSRTYYYAVNLSTGKTGGFSPKAPWNNPVEGKIVEIPSEVAIITRLFFCGNDCGITVHVAPDTVAKNLLEQK